MVVQAPPPMVSFAKAPAGWERFDTGNGAVALSWRYRIDSPLGWASAMPAGGIAVQVFFLEGVPRSAPLRLALPASPTTTLDGAPNTPEYRIEGRVDGHEVAVWVDIRSSHPSRALLRRAQRLVSAIRFQPLTASR